MISGVWCLLGVHLFVGKLNWYLITTISNVSFYECTEYSRSKQKVTFVVSAQFFDGLWLGHSFETAQTLWSMMHRWNFLPSTRSSQQLSKDSKLTIFCVQKLMQNSGPWKVSEWVPLKLLRVVENAIFGQFCVFLCLGICSMTWNRENHGITLCYNFIYFNQKIRTNQNAQNKRSINLRGKLSIKGRAQIGHSKDAWIRTGNNGQPLHYCARIELVQSLVKC